MDFLNKSFAQVADLFRSMTPGARITAGLLLAAVVVSLGYLFNHQMTGADAFLLGGHAFSANEVPQVESALAAAGLKDYQWDGNRMRVPRHQQPAYVAALAEGKALPLNWGDYLTRALDDGSPFSYGKEREQRLNIARQQELGLVLRSMKDVVNATVQYDTKKAPGLGPKQISTASVAVQLAGGQQLDSERVKMIRQLVAGSFAGLSAENVIVADLNGRVHTAMAEDGIGAGDDHRYLAATQAYSRAFEERIRSALSYVPGVNVVVYVELSTDLGRKSETIKHDPKVANVSSREQTSSKKTESAPAGGAPGLASQQANAPAKLAASAKGASSEEESSVREESNVVNVDKTLLQEIGMTPRRVTVSIGVPDKYFEEVWRRRNPTPAGETPKTPDPAVLAQIESEEIINIKKHAAHLLPKPENLIDPTPLVTVTRFAHIQPPMDPGPSIAALSLAWLGEYWSTLGVIGLGLVSLVMLRSMIRATPPAASRSIDLPEIVPPGEEREEPAAGGAAAAAGGTEQPRARLRRKTSTGESLRDDLVEMVREDPDAAAAILRTWIGTAT
jgi:flagellar M-ring protein FliF